MQVKTTIKYSIKDDMYKVETTDENGEIKYFCTRLFSKEYEAELAATLVKLFADKVDSSYEFDKNMLDWSIRMILRMVDSPGKW